MIEKRLKELEEMVESIKRGDFSIDELSFSIEKAMKLIESIEADIKKEEKKVEIFFKKE